MALPLNLEVEALPERLDSFDKPALVLQWRNLIGGKVPDHLPRWLLARLLAYRVQAQTYGGLDAKILRSLKQGTGTDSGVRFETRPPRDRAGANLAPGTILVREWQSQLQRVTVMQNGFAWGGETYASLSRVAQAITGTNWNGHRFFGLQGRGPYAKAPSPRSMRAST